MFGKLLVASLTLVSIACANPKYVSPGVSSTENKTSSGTCAAKFSSGECVDLTWEKKPTDSEFGSFVFKTFRSNYGDGSPMPIDMTEAPSIKMWMPSMGHGSPPVTVTRVDIGTYRASNVFFTMKGDWEIHFQIKDGDTVRDEAVLPFSL